MSCNVLVAENFMLDNRHVEPEFIEKFFEEEKGKPA
jgi:hypothetical protein